VIIFDFLLFVEWQVAKSVYYQGEEEYCIESTWGTECSTK